MNPEMAIDIFKTVVMFSLYLVAPFLGVTLVVVVTIWPSSSGPLRKST